MGGPGSWSRLPAWFRPLLLAVGIVVLGLIQEDKAHSWEQPAWLPIIDLAIGWLLVACGLISMAARPEQAAGARLVIAGYLSFELGYKVADDPTVSMLGFAFGNYNDLALMVLALSFPDRLARWRPARILITTTAALYLLQSVIRIVASLPGIGGPVILDLDVLMPGIAVVDVIRAASVAACGLAMIWLLTRIPTAQRRSMGLVLAAGAATAFASATNAQYALTYLGLLPPIGDDVVIPMSWAFNVVRIAVPLAILGGVLRTQFARRSLIAAVRNVGSTPSTAALRDALATALGDPGLQLLTLDPGSGRYEGGGSSLSPVELDALAAEPGHPVAPVVVDGSRVAALILTAPPIDDGLVEAGVSLTGLVVQNQRLAALVQDQLLAVHASRARIVEAADRERRRIERDLHDGLQQRMVALAVELRAAQTDLSEGHEALQRGADEVLEILADVRELARGIHPAILTEAGLGPAIQAAANRSPIPVEVSLHLPGSRSPAVAATAYYVASEALANVAKHAGVSATAAWITAEEVDGRLRIVVEDDGVGGADPTGHGLGGLADRVAALDGTFEVGPRHGGGTRVEAVIPVT